LSASATIRLYQGDPGGFLEIREARDLGLRLGLGRSTAVAMNNVAGATLFFEGPRPALEVWDEGIRFANARGLTYPAMWQRGERLASLYHLGEWEELVREADEVLGWLAEVGGGQLEVIVKITLAEVLVHRGAVAEAAAHVDELLPRARESGDPQVLFPGLSVAALVAFEQGKVATALECVGELERLTRGGGPVWRSLGLVWPVRLATAAGRLDLAESFLDGSEASSAWAGCARIGACATLAEARGLVDEAVHLYAQAVTGWGSYGSVVEQAYALLGLGRLGDTAARREGEAVFVRLGASPVLARAA
jgi:hypothetical protein